jgi:hypothetical protein
MTYEQAIELKIPLDKLRPTPTTHRVGGVEGPGYFLEQSKMLLRDYTGKLHGIDVPTIVVLGSSISKQKVLPVPALLGDDILRQFTLIVESDQQGGEVIITDEAVSLTPRPSSTH